MVWMVWCNIAYTGNETFDKFYKTKVLYALGITKQIKEQKDLPTFECYWFKIKILNLLSPNLSFLSTFYPF